MRTLYLTRSLSMNGRSSFAGRKLYDALAEQSEAALVGFYVLPPEAEDASIPKELQPDAIRTSAFRALDPSLIYFEGGLGFGDEDWRVPQALLDQFVESGGVAVIADVDCAKVARQKTTYQAASAFLGAEVDFGPANSNEPVYAVDQSSYWESERSIIAVPDRMRISGWLKPVYEGIDEIVIGLPAALRYADNILVSGNFGTTGTLQYDVWVEPVHAVPIASVRAYGRGYVVFIAGGVSSDVWLERTDGNIRWILNCVRFLLEEAAADKRRREPLRELQESIVAARALAAVHKGDEAGDVLDEKTSPAVENEARRIECEELGLAAEVRTELEQSFSAELWARLPSSSVRFLVTADVLRRELEGYASVDPTFDFSGAVITYSKALEAAVMELLFRPYQEAPEFHARPEPATKVQRTSLDLIGGFVGGKHLGLGTMARCLMNVACALRTSRDNGFSRFLESRLRDLDEFCDAAQFPKRLVAYSDAYRNGAAHVQAMSMADCADARAYLLEEPTKLLVELVAQLSDTAA